MDIHLSEQLNVRLLFSDFIFYYWMHHFVVEPEAKGSLGREISRLSSLFLNISTGHKKLHEKSQLEKNAFWAWKWP